MSWKHDIGGWVANGRDASRRTPRANNAGHNALDSVLSGVTARSSPALNSTRPKSPLLNRSSPTRTPLTEGGHSTRASPSSLNNTGKGRGNGATGAGGPSDHPTGTFAPKSWAAAASAARATSNLAPRMAKVVFAERVDDRSQLMSMAPPAATHATSSPLDASSLSLPSLRARSSGALQNTSIQSSSPASNASNTNKSRWVTLFGGTCGEFHHALHYLASRCGPIRRVHWPASSANCNWLHVQFVDTLGAAAAVDKGTIRVSLPAVGLVQASVRAGFGFSEVLRSSTPSAAAATASTLQFGVTWCHDTALILHYRQEDIEEEKAQRLLCDLGELGEEDRIDDFAENIESIPQREVLDVDRGDNRASVGPLDRVAQLSEASKRFSLADASSALLHTSAMANRNYHGSFSASALGGSAAAGRGYHTNRSGFYLSSHVASKEEARNDAVYVPVVTTKGHKSAADIWVPSDVPRIPRVADAICSAVARPLEWGLGWWLSEPTSNTLATSNTTVATAPNNAEEDWSIFSFFFGSGVESETPINQPSMVHKNVVLHCPTFTTVVEPVSNDVRTVVRPIPFYLDYGRLVSLLGMLLVVFLLYSLFLSPFVDAVLGAIVNLVSFVFGTLGLAFSWGSSDRGHSLGGAGRDNRAAAPSWEYLYESNFNNDNNRNDFYSF